VKRLTLLRHAKSSWDNAAADDFDRPLNDRGWKAARRIGRELKHRGMHFDFVIASTAARVRETIDGVQDHYDFDGPIQFEPRMYGASEGELLVLVRGLPESVKAPLLVGHNPGLERLLVDLTRDDEDGLRHRVADKYPTGAMAVLELPTHRWAGVAPGNGKIVELILPKELD
jgi:phosphohistidine phosphatase